MKILAAIFTVILILTNLAAASENLAPANDSFASATTVVLNGSSISVAANNTDATKEAGEPNHAENTGGKSVWFNFTPQTTMNVRINTVNTNFDTLLAVYTGNAVGSLTLVGWNDNCSNTCEAASMVDLMLTGGVTYRIAVDGANYGSGASSGNFTLAISSLTAPIQDNLNAAYDLGNNFTGSIAGTNYNATVEPGEQPFQGSDYPVRKSVWYRWRPNGNYSVDFELTENFNSMISIWSSSVPNPTHAQLSRVQYNADFYGYTWEKYRATFYARSDKYYFISIDSWTNNAPNAGNFQLKFYLHRLSYTLRQGVTEQATIAVFRPSTSVWHSILPYTLTNSRKFGIAGDMPVPADYDGDGYADYAVTRNENGQKIWYIGIISNLTYRSVMWGLASDKPLVGDFDRDGVADLTVVRQTPNGQLVWYARQSSNLSMRVFHWGLNTDKPVVGDFDNDGATDLAVIRNQNGQLIWYILKSNYPGSGSYTEWQVVPFGLNGDKAAVADYDGDRQSDIAVFRPSTGVWYILRSSDNQLQALQFGISEDIPQPADYDGDGKASVGVFRPSTGVWYTSPDPSTNYGAIHWGMNGDIPVTSFMTAAQ